MSVSSSFLSPLASFLLAGVFLVAGVYTLGYQVAQSNFTTIGLGYALAFGGYALAILHDPGNSKYLRWGIFLAITLRLLLLPSFPALSDDVYRFIWDGRLLLTGHNPFDYLPGHYLAPENAVPGITRQLYEQLNSPDYFTIYPPVAQAIFAFAVWLYPQSVAGATFIMQLIIFCAEIGSILLIIKLLREFELPPNRVILYALNPLIIVELTGNLHFEGIMIFFLLAGIYFLQKNKPNWSALLMALSVATKLLPLLFFPFLIRRLGWRSVGYFALVAVALLLLFYPLISGVFLQNFGSSLDLYFRKFEFNASIYYVLRWLGFQYKGYNIIAQLGPALAVVTFVGILTAAWRNKSNDYRSFWHLALFASTLYLLFTTTVHPWYLALPLVCCVFTRYRFPIIWSALIPVTYFSYTTFPYQENLTLVALEYALVILFGIWYDRKTIGFQ